jgi:hypothetical protein
MVFKHVKKIALNGVLGTVSLVAALKPAGIIDPIACSRRRPAEVVVVAFAICQCERSAVDLQWKNFFFFFFSDLWHK